jgi:hypothetical protein
VCWRQNSKQATAPGHTLQRVSVNAEDFGGPTEIVMVHFQRAHIIVSLEILERHPAGYLRST